MCTLPKLTSHWQIPSRSIRQPLLSDMSKLLQSLVRLAFHSCVAVRANDNTEVQSMSSGTGMLLKAQKYGVNRCCS